MSNKKGRVSYWILGGVLIVWLSALFTPAITCGPESPLILNILTCNQLLDIHKTLKIFKSDNETYPTEKEGLEALVKNPDPQKYVHYPRKPYILKLLRDSWREPIFYHLYKTDKGEEVELISFGADGKYGGEEENSDIVYPGCDDKK